MFKVIFLILLIILGRGYYLVRETKIQIRPYPYFFKTNSFSQAEIDRALSANILIFGDHQLRHLERFKSQLEKAISTGLKKNIAIEIINSEHEGLHRSLYKLQQLPKLPPIIIYLGGNDEHYEKIFNLADYHKIEANIKKSQDDTYSSLIMAFPPLSKIIYSSLYYVELGETPKKETDLINAHGEQTKLRIQIELQKLALQDFLDTVRVAEKNMILITAPLNLETRPKKACANTETDKGKDLEHYFEKEISSGKSKEIYRPLQDYVNATMANANAYFLLGKAQKELGKISEARQSFIMAAAYDCGPWRINPTFNHLVRQKAQENGVTLIDFENLINQNLGRDNLFLDQYIPQDIYFEMLINQIAKHVKTMLNL